MKPLDPRLLRYARSSRRFLVLGAIAGLVQTAAFVGFAWMVATVVTGAIDGRPLADLIPSIWLGVAAVALRAAMQWLTERAAAGAVASAKRELRAELLAAVAALGPARLGRGTAEVTTLATHGLEALDPYFGKYLPQLILSAIAMPLLILVTWFVDPVSAITEVLTLPVIPLFMILIGWATRRVQVQQMDALGRLAGSFLEIVEGLATLKIFGRAARQRERIGAITDDFRRTTMRVLRVSFLSGFALELFASLSVALVAVQIGIRLIDRDMTLFVGLVALILAPEVFAPLRQVGAQFHAAAEGVEASERVFELIERADALAAPVAGSATVGGSAPAVGSGPGAVPREGRVANAGPPGQGLELRGASVRYGDHLVLDRLDAVFPRGAITAITGESGVGKTTLLSVVRGEIAAEGERRLDGAPLADSDAHHVIAWMGQSAGLLTGTLRANLALGRSEVPDADLTAALELAGLDAAALGPHPLELELGVGGEGLSGGQAQRASLARTIVRARAIDAAIVLADEPTSALDEEREQTVIAALRALAEEGRVVIVVSHRPAVVAAADRVLALTAPAPIVAGPAPSEGAS